MTRGQLIKSLINDSTHYLWMGTSSSIIAYSTDTKQMELYGPTATKGWTYLCDLGITPSKAADLGHTANGRSMLGILGDKTAALYV